MDVIGVRFKKAGKTYEYKTGAANVEIGAGVICETARGLEMGDVEYKKSVPENSETKTITRVATEDDKARVASQKAKADDHIKLCAEKIAKHKLDMRLVGVEQTFDGNKIIFYFTADGRVDFRELVKELAATFRMRIELRQIGVRDEAKIMNGIGICGRELCCATFLEEFHPVSIKMAKEQNLSLNPTKISGICGRLMCCLKYEEDVYEYLNRDLPREGDTIRTPEGDGEVLSVSVLAQIVKAAVRKRPQDSAEIMSFPAKDVKIIKRAPREDGVDYKELKEILD